MHEVGLLAAAVAEVATAAGGRRVAAVALVLGPGVDRAAAEQAWQTAAAGTCLAGADVSWRRGGDGLVCLDCGREYDGDRLSRCPTCSANGLVVAPAPEIAVVDWSTAIDAKPGNST